jgi:MFS family permease
MMQNSFSREQVKVLISGCFSAFAGYTYIAWGPAFVQEYIHFSAREAGLLLGATTIVAGILGVMTGATLADRMSKRGPWGRAIIVPVGFLISAPFIYLAIDVVSRPGNGYNSRPYTGARSCERAGRLLPVR